MRAMKKAEESREVIRVKDSEIERQAYTLRATVLDGAI